jgi:hypothetical protein
MYFATWVAPGQRGDAISTAVVSVVPIARLKVTFDLHHSFAPDA